MNWFKKLLVRVNQTAQEVLFPFVSYFVGKAPIFTEWSVNKAYKDGYTVNPYVYRAIDLINNSINSIKLKVVDKNGQEVQNHPIVALLKQPHSHVPPYDFYTFVWLHYNLVGNAFIQKLKVGEKTKQLFPILPDKISVIPSDQPGELISGYQIRTGQKLIEVQQSDIIHLKKVDPTNLLTGMPTLKAAGKAVDIATEQDKWNYNGLFNRFVSDTIIKLKDGTNQASADALKDRFNDTYSGSENARKVMFLSGIEDVYKLGAGSHQDVDFTEGKKMTIQEISIAFGVPLPLLGVLEKATYSNFETAERVFWEQTIIPILNNLVSTLNWSFADELADGQEITFDTKQVKVLQRNYSDRVKDTALLTAKGVSMQECNRVLELGLDLKDFKEPAVKVNPNDPNQSITDPNQKDPINNNQRSIIQVRDLNIDWEWRKADKKREYWAKRMEALFRSAFNDEQQKIIQLVQSNELDAVLPAIDQQIGSWENAFRTTYRKVIDAFVSEFVSGPGDFEALLNDYTNNFIRSQIGQKITYVKQTTKDAVAKIIEDSRQKAHTVAEVQGILSDENKYRELVSETVQTSINDKYESFGASRALTIARTEVAAASGYGQMTAGIISGFENKIWISSRDKEVRVSHQHLDGQKVGILDHFANGVMHPGDPNGAPGEVINCRCSLTFS